MSRWTGVLLKDLLEHSGLDAKRIQDARHVQFIGKNREKKKAPFKSFAFYTGHDAPYDASVPIEKVLNPYGDVLVAFEMNGKPIPRDCGKKRNYFSS